MKVIGLCGGSGSGKGTVCEIFRENGIPTIDTDAVYRDLTNRPGKLLDALESEFGSDVITVEGSFDRKALANIVFSGVDSSEKLKKLNSIAHKYILDEARAMLHSYSVGGASLGVVDAPVLFESGFDSECDCVVCVIADRERRVERIVARDSITKAEAERRIDAQISDAELIAKCDFVIRNDSDLDSLRCEVISTIEKIIRK